MEDPLATLDNALARFPFPAAARGQAASCLGIVAFSGGPDSTALLLALMRRWRRDEPGHDRRPPLLAAHLDHAADPGSRDRARQAARIARRLGVPFVSHRLAASQVAPHGEGAEAAARQRRYAFLARVAADCGAPWIATAHHRDDQAETVLLRLAAGSGLRGLGAMRFERSLPVLRPPGRAASPGPRPRLVRPLLDLTRATLAAAVAAAGLEPTDDATNRDPSIPRNRLRHYVLPPLEATAADRGEPPLAPRLAALAAATRRAFAVIDSQLATHLDLTAAPSPAASVALAPLASLPPAVFPHALSLLHAAAGAPLPARHQAHAELRRQLDEGGRIGCDCGAGWRWESVGGDRLVLLRRSPPVPSLELRTVFPRAAAPVRPPGGSPRQGFSYILEVPGEVEIRELGLALRLYRAPLAAWMYRGSPHRAGLALALSPGDTVSVRGRRPGDRMRPLGAGGSRRLKDLLIDHRVPRDRRHRLPLLTIAGEIAWVPGITVDERCRLPTQADPGATVWVAELTRSPLRTATPSRHTAES